MKKNEKVLLFQNRELFQIFTTFNKKRTFDIKLVEDVDSNLDEYQAVFKAEDLLEKEGGTMRNFNIEKAAWIKVFAVPPRCIDKDHVLLNNCSPFSSNQQRVPIAYLLDKMPKLKERHEEEKRKLIDKFNEIYMKKDSKFYIVKCKILNNIMDNLN